MHQETSELPASAIIAPGVDLSRVKFTFRGTPGKLVIGEGAIVVGGIFMSQGATLVIEPGVRINGANFYLHEASEVRIGAGSLISFDVNFRPADLHRIFDIATGERINPPAPIVLGERVWVGQSVHLLKGATIADDCIVGAASVVTGTFSETNCILAGVPARIVRHGVRWAP